MGWLRAAGALLVVTLFTLVFLPFQLAAIRFKTPDPKPIPLWFHRLAARMLGIRMHVEGRPSNERPLLVVANHASWLDIVVLGALIPGSFVAKADMAGWPAVGLLAKLHRTIFVDRTDRRRTGEQSSEIARRLGAGDVVILFPEGTTSDGNRVLPFNTSLFGAARAVIAAGHEALAIQPVTVAYTHLHGLPMGRQLRRAATWIGDEDLAPHLLARLKEGALDVSVRFGEPERFTAGTDRKEIARRLEAEIAANLAEINSSLRRM